jgi:hypothetical protein
VVADGEHQLKQLYRWDKAEGGLTPLTFGFFHENQSTQRLIRTILQNECVNLRLSDMPDDEAAFYRSFGMKS